MSHRVHVNSAIEGKYIVTDGWRWHRLCDEFRQSVWWRKKDPERLCSFSPTLLNKTISSSNALTSREYCLSVSWPWLVCLFAEVFIASAKLGCIADAIETELRNDLFIHFCSLLAQSRFQHLFIFVATRTNTHTLTLHVSFAAVSFTSSTTRHTQRRCSSIPFFIIVSNISICSWRVNYLSSNGSTCRICSYIRN